MVGVIDRAGGFLLELVADVQKARFRHNPANVGKWITSGCVRSSVKFPHQPSSVVSGWSVLADPSLAES